MTYLVLVYNGNNTHFKHKIFIIIDSPTIDILKFKPLIVRNYGQFEDNARSLDDIEEIQRKTMQLGIQLG